VREPAAASRPVVAAPMRRAARHRQQLVLSRRLVQLREAAGLTQAVLALRLGITQSEVSKFERGERAMDVLQLRAWLKALGIAFAPFADALDRELERVERCVDAWPRASLDAEPQRPQTRAPLVPT